MGWLRRLVEAERRAGPPVNRFMVKFYEWVFVVIGPVGVILGSLGLAYGRWLGVVLIAVGLVMTWLGWRRLLRSLTTPRRER